MTTIRLTRRQHECLWMDVVEIGHPDDVSLIKELRAGRVLTVTPLLIANLREFADRDQDPREQRVYRRLLRAALAHWTNTEEV